jgi:hypothetical protein
MKVIGQGGGVMMTLKVLPQAQHARLILAMLGKFRLLWGTSVVGVPRASQRFFALVVLHGRMVERDTVGGTLWPHASERHAHSNLPTALTRLNRIACKALSTTDRSRARNGSNHWHRSVRDLPPIPAWVRACRRRKAANLDQG